MMQRPNSLEYESIPDFLRALFVWKKFEQRSFSLRNAARKSADISYTTLSRLLSGKIDLRLDHLHSLQRVFSLTPEEIKWLTWMIQGDEPSLHALAMLKRKHKIRPANHLLSHWLNVYIKDAVTLRSFDENPEKLAELLGSMASPQEIAKSLQFLERNGFILRGEHGRFKPADPHDRTTDEIPSSDIVNFHCKALDVVQEKIRSLPPSSRESYTLTLTLDQKSIPKLKTLIKELRERLEDFSLEHSGETDHLCQVVLHFAPLTLALNKH